MSSHPPHLPPVLGLLDVGTSKIVCVMLARNDRGAYAVIGLGHQKSRGLKASVIIDSDATEDAVRATLVQAEHMAGVALEHVVISAASGRLTSTHFAAGLNLNENHHSARPVTPPDLDRLIDAARRHAERDDRAALHLNFLATRIDNQPISGPVIGVPGRHLAMDVHAVTADRAPLRHLLHVAERCQLTVAAVAPAPLASALAVTTPEDRHSGTVVIDCGAGSTSLTQFVHGNLVAAHVIPIGSNHITYDLMRALDTSITEAERIKKKYAIQQLAQPAADDAVAYQPRADSHAHSNPTSKQVTRAQISTIITSRVDALLRQLRQRLDQSAIPSQPGSQILLTGGASLLVGLAERAAAILERAVRVAQPLPNGCLPGALLQPAFATVAGLQTIAFDRNLGLRLNSGHAHHTPNQAWLRQSL